MRWSRDGQWRGFGCGSWACSAADGASRAAAERMLVKRIKDIVGVSTEVIVGDPGSVARSQGKAVRVVDNRAKG